MQGPGKRCVIMCIGVMVSLSGTPPTLRAQTLSLPPLIHPSLAARFPAEIRAAEAEGAGYPRARTTTRRCVDASGSAQAESGDLRAGPFDAYPAIWRQGSGKLWWRPATAVEGETLLVRAQSLDRPKTVKTYRLTSLTRTSGASGMGSVPSGPLFYPSSIRLPSAGAWLLVASVGKNWGCFLLIV